MSTTQATGRVAALPVVRTPIVGRGREAADIRALLAGDTRLVTITGPGGIGKTRLGVHIARGIRDDLERDVAFVSLAALRDVDMVLPAIAQAFGMPHEMGEDEEEELFQALQESGALVVLDNLEQIPEAGSLVQRLLERCPAIAILATSQVPMEVEEERAYQLAPLPTPDPKQRDPDEIVATDAVTLFANRARERAPWFTIDERNADLVAEICRQLDGLPLAIELAAARINVVSLATLRDRLSASLEVLGSERSDVPDRLRTMRNAIAWSYELLDPAEQALFRRLSVFRGGFPADAAVAVWTSEARRVLRILVHRSLVVRQILPDGTIRYAVLEALRAYGRERLRAAGEERDVRWAHANWYVAFAEDAEPQLSEGAVVDWHDRLDLEIENIRAAIEWMFENGDLDGVMRIGGAVWRYMSARGLLRECRGWLDRALASPGGNPAWRVRALVGLGYITEDLRDLDAARAAFEQARHLAAALGDSRGEARALTGLGTVAHDRGLYDDALEMHSEAARISREAGDRRGVAVGMASMAIVSYYRGDLADAVRHWEECLEIAVELGDTVTETQLLGNLGAVTSELRQLDEARSYLERGRDLQRKLRLQSNLPYTLVNLGEVYRKIDMRSEARATLAEALEMLGEMGNSMVEGHALNALARLELDEGNIVAAAEAITESMWAGLSTGDQHAIIDNAEVVAMLCCARGEHASALELLAAASALREELRAQPTPDQIRERGDVERVAFAALDAAAIEEAHATGTALDAEALARRAMTLSRRLARPAAVPAPKTPEPARAPVPNEYGLTPRELEVLALLARGHTTRQVADALSISSRTAATHVTNILGKMEVTSRTAAVALSLRVGIIPESPG
jgi:predicted ATPase/DNA-binding CsgD family transcriptional regulator